MSTSTRNGTTAELKAALQLLGRDLWPIALHPPKPEDDPRNRGKRPIGNGWGRDRWDEDRLRETFERHPGAGVGLCLGPGRGPEGRWLLDVEGDGPEADASLASLFGGELPETIGWGSVRGSHRLFMGDPETVAELAAALAELGTERKGQPGVFKLDALPDLEFRIGGTKADGTVKQVQSVAPPTKGTDGTRRRWFECGEFATWPSSATEAVRRIARVSGKAEPEVDRRAKGHAPGDGTARTRYALAALSEEVAAVETAPEGSRNDRLNIAAFALGQFVGAGVLAEATVRAELRAAASRAGLGEAETERTITSGLEAGKGEPRDLSGVGARSSRVGSNGRHHRPETAPEGEGREPAGKATAAGERPAFGNYRLIPGEGKEARPRREPIDQPELLDALDSLTDGWPRRAGEVLFAHDGGDAEPVTFTGPDQLLAWVANRATVVWGEGASLVSQRRFFEALRQSAARYDAIERHPHFPAVGGVYYACSPAKGGGDGRTLAGLIDLFSPATPADRELIRAFILTLFWGGPPGKRPMFLAEGPENDPLGGRGVGKSELFSTLAGLVGGAIANISARDDISAITKRIINDKARKRCVLLDNVKAERFSWGDLEGLITGPTVGAWLNYVGDEIRPNLFTYCMTINGASLSEDLAQRTVMIRLDRPRSYDLGGEAWSDVVARYVAEHRREIIADVAAAFAGPAEEIRSHQRWASWTHAVLARCDTPHTLQRVILDRQDVVNDDRATSNEFARFLARKIESHTGKNPAGLVLWISSDALVPIVSEFTTEKCSPMNVSKKINRFRPRQLTKKPREAARGWLWTGDDATPDTEHEEPWIHAAHSFRHPDG